MQGINSKRRLVRGLFAAGAAMLAIAVADAAPLASLDRNGSIVAVEPYAPNVVRVTIAVDRDQADAPPGDGPNAKSDPAGWTHRTEAAGDVFSSSALTLTVNAQPWPSAPTQMARYFAPSLPPVGLRIADGAGKTLTEMTGWEMAPHVVNGEKTFRVGASFSVAPGEPGSSEHATSVPPLHAPVRRYSTGLAMLPAGFDATTVTFVPAVIESL